MLLRRLSLGIFLLLPVVWLAPVAPMAARTAASTDQDDTERVPPGHHRVLRGETLWSIAMRYNTSVGELMDANHLDNGKLKPGLILRIPSAESPAPAHRGRTYVVQEDDTLRSVARSNHVSEKSLRDANPKVNFQRLKQGIRLTIPKNTEGEKSEDSSRPPAKVTESMPSSRGTQTHVIKGDETFSSLARRYGVKVSDLMAANPDVKPERLHDGMTIKIPSKKHVSSDSTTTKEANQEQNPSPTKEKNSHPSKEVASKKSAPSEDSNSEKPAKHSSSTAKTTPKVATNKKASSDTTEKAQEEDKPTPSSSKHSVASADKKAPSALASKKDSPSTPASSNKKATEAPAKTKSEPATTQEQIADNNPAHAPKMDNASGEVRSYIVKSGESAQAIAQSYGVTAKQLLDYNHLSADAKLRSGDEIMIPKRGNVASASH